MHIAHMTHAPLTFKGRLKKNSWFMKLLLRSAVLTWYSCQARRRLADCIRLLGYPTATKDSRRGDNSLRLWLGFPSGFPNDSASGVLQCPLAGRSLSGGQLYITNGLFTAPDADGWVTMAPVHPRKCSTYAHCTYLCAYVPRSQSFWRSSRKLALSPSQPFPSVFARSWMFS